MVDATRYAHDVVTLAAASTLTDAGNAVELAEPEGDSRTADLRLRTTAVRYVRSEVKAPIALQRPAELSREAAEDVVERQVASARGQLGSDAPGLLVIGGFSLRRRDLDLLEEQALRSFTRSQTGRPHILGIALVSIGVHLNPATAAAPLRLSAINELRLVRNPRYQGDVRISEHPREGSPLRPLDETLRTDSTPR